jgi:hypothetical protein
MSQSPKAAGRQSDTGAEVGAGGSGLNRQINLKKAWFPAALALITVVALIQRVPGLGPFSLFLDDQWVAVLVRDASISQIFSLRPPAPLGFLLLLKLVSSVAGAGSTALQVLPFLCGLAAIPLLGWTAYRWTGHATLGVIAAPLLALDPVLGVYSLRVKPFAGDALVTVVLLTLAVEAMRSQRRRWLIALASVAAVAPLFSIPSLIPGGVLVNALAFWRWFKQRKSWDNLAIAAAYDAVVIAIFFTLLAGQRNEALVQYWAANYLPLNDPSALGSFFARGAGLAFILNPFSTELWWVPFLLLPGVAWLIARRELRPLGAMLGLVVIAVFIASALRLYPVGHDRLDLFAHPVLLLIVAAAFMPPTPRFRAVPIVGVAVFAVALLLSGTYGYPPVGDRQMVNRAAAALRDEDGLVVYPWANYAAGLYGPWPTEIVRVTDSTNRFYVHLRRPNTLVLHESLDGVDFQQDPRVMVDQLKPFVDRGYRRIVYVSGTTMSRPHEWACGYIISRGYRVTRAEEVEGATLVVFER